MSRIADEAAAAVQERMRDYGPPAENHICTASLWIAYIARRHGVVIPLDAEDVCLLNVLQKVSREAHARKRDNLVDIVGFVINAEMVAESIATTKDLYGHLDTTDVLADLAIIEGRA